ncbi:DNA-binding transcriptional regulator, PadR family [Brevibacillus centrosporus]|jgi:PadR family transcriptional regulator PadR|uniref:DNA-binding transcriptional regulator, PadR family n=2 Tax=Brevibacillus TaxID=55080 RepID=A0A1I3ZX83_9BACL|nr:DNA-binding transcriptional regulator, PadR family [Brevibacillus centrosporus]
MMGESSISSDMIRGHLDAIILRVLSEGDNYGYEIIKAIAKNSDGQYELKEPSLYTSLKRLEAQKLISSYWGDETQGGRRKYYRLTGEGAEAYEKALAAWKVARALIDQLMERQE